MSPCGPVLAGPFYFAHDARREVRRLAAIGFMAEIDKQAEASSRAVFREIGSTGLKQSAGQVLEDPLPELRTLEQRVRAFKEMRDDPVAGAVLFAIEQFCKTAPWDVEPADDSDSGRRDADFLRENMNGMSHSWLDFVQEALTMLQFGFSVHEIVYKSAPDGSIRWKKLPIRGQDTILAWVFDDEGGIKGIEQRGDWQPGKPPTVFIPIEKLLLFRTSSTKNSPEARSVLRTAYRPYYFKKRIEVIEAIGIERNLAGYPVLYVPDDLFIESEEAKARLKYAQEIVSRIRKDEAMGAVLPQSWKDAGGLVLLASEGSQTMDTERVIQRYDARIAMSVLADIILMGHENAGSYALAEVKRSLLGQAMMSWLDIIAEVVNRYAVPRLFALNGRDPGREKLPRVIHGPVVNVDPKTLADIIFRLSGVDALRTDPKLRKFLRKFLGLPEAESDELEETQALAEARQRDALARALGGRPDNETRPPAL